MSHNRFRHRPRRARHLSERHALHRRRDGRGPAPHRALAQHQGAPRLLLRPLRRPRPRHRHGRPHAGASRLHAHVGAGSHCGDRFAPGDIAILNDPYAGGTHLPDITMVLPVFVPGRTAPAFYVSNRAHHADVGGRSQAPWGRRKRSFKRAFAFRLCASCAAALWTAKCST